MGHILIESPILIQTPRVMGGFLEAMWLWVEMRVIIVTVSTIVLMDTVGTPGMAGTNYIKDREREAREGANDIGPNCCTGSLHDISVV